MGIKKDLKDIAFAVGRDVRGRLLLEDLVRYYEDPALPNLKGFLDAQVTQTLGEATVINECIEELNKQRDPATKAAPDLCGRGLE
jgi:hypothetical protein